MESDEAWASWVGCSANSVTSIPILFRSCLRDRLGKVRMALLSGGAERPRSHPSKLRGLLERPLEEAGRLFAAMRQD